MFLGYFCLTSHGDTDFNIGIFESSWWHDYLVFSSTLDQFKMDFYDRAEGEAVPAAIATRISTRSLSGKARTKSKPSLGAKKFGAIRLSQPPPKTESDWAHEVEAPKTSDPMQSAKTNLWHQEPVSAPVQVRLQSTVALLYLFLFLPTYLGWTYIYALAFLRIDPNKFQ